MYTHKHVYTWKHTLRCAYTRGEVPPDVMCVSVYVDRDQRWVLKHFRPLLSPHSHSIDSVRPATEQPNLTLSITGSMQESMLHCTHRHTISPHCLLHSVSLPLLGYFIPSICIYVCLFVPSASAPLEDTKKSTHNLVHTQSQGFLEVLRACHKSK